MRRYLPTILFVVAGIIIVIVGIFVAINNSSKNFVKITGKISEIWEEPGYYDSEEYSNNAAFFFTYTYDGQEYKNVKLDYYDAFHFVGDKIEFYVNADRPGEITKSPAITAYIVVGMGILFTGLGIFALIKTKRSQNFYQ